MLQVNADVQLDRVVDDDVGICAAEVVSEPKPPRATARTLAGPRPPAPSSGMRRL